jgi:hypothetical protein
VYERRQHGLVRIGSVIAQQIDQRDLRPAFPRHPARGDQRERRFEDGSIGFRARFEDDPGHLDDVGRQAAMTDRVFGGEFEQRRIFEIVSTLEADSLAHHAGMLAQMGAKPFRVAGIEEVHRPAEEGVRDPLVVRPIEAGPLRALDLGLEPRPTRKAVFAGDGELGVAQGELRAADAGVGGASETGVKFPQALARLGISSGVGLQQVPGLMLEMVEIRAGRQALGRHESSLSRLRPASAPAGGK